MPEDRLQVHSNSDAQISENNFPPPDIAAAAGGPSEYANRYPVPADIRRVVEVSVTSLGRDRGLKRRRYAAAGLSPYLIVNLLARRAEVHERPENGTYLERREVAERQTLSFELDGVPVELDVSSLLPPN